MDGASLATTGGQIALAVAAGTVATKKVAAATAIQDRFQALKRAISRKSPKIRLAEIEEDPASDAHRSALARDLDEHGASKDRDVVTTAKELLGLIKVDDAARTAVDDMITDVEAALIQLSDVDVEADPKAKEPKEANEAKPGPAASDRAAAGSKRDLLAETGSRRVIPPDEPSKTELERTALPFWKRTERFGMKAGIFAFSCVAIALTTWLLLRTPPNETLERCRKGDSAGCWQLIAAEDAVDQGRKVSAEPLQLLCGKHQDPCACAGLAYLNASDTERSPDCTEVSAVTALDPKWPCTCKRYDFWRWGQQRTSHCGIPRCE
jgi:hypothetical protein